MFCPAYTGSGESLSVTIDRSGMQRLLIVATLEVSAQLLLPVMSTRNL